jgi:hypothetical protein
MTSRNQREGRYVGRYRGQHVRRRDLMPALLVGDVELFPPSVPFADSSIAWLTMQHRRPVPPRLPLRIRYRHQGVTVEVRFGEGDD